MKVIRLGSDEVFHRYLTPRCAFVPTSGAAAAVDGAIGRPRPVLRWNCVVR